MKVFENEIEPTIIWFKKILRLIYTNQKSITNTTVPWK